MFDLSLAISHHLLIFALFGVLAAELVLVRSNLDQATVARVGSIDLWYGVVAGAIVVVGFTRAIFAAKGWAYYEHNAFFWAKMTAFVCVALLSILPTIKYIVWRRAGTVPSETEIAVVRRFLWAEVALFALLPAFAAAMARGFGEAAY
jgi:putative membrane protein